MLPCTRLCATGLSFTHNHQLPFTVYSEEAICVPPYYGCRHLTDAAGTRRPLLFFPFPALPASLYLATRPLIFVFKFPCHHAIEAMQHSLLNARTRLCISVHPRDEKWGALSSQRGVAGALGAKGEKWRGEISGHSCASRDGPSYTLQEGAAPAGGSGGMGAEDTGAAKRRGVMPGQLVAEK